MKLSNRSFPAPAMLGLEVGAARWPQPLHSGLPPWKGIVLALNDKRAWGLTIAFAQPAAAVSQEAIDSHVRDLLDRGLLKDHVPVIWDFGDKFTVYWSSAADLVPYAEDVRRWRVAYDSAMVDISSPTSPYVQGRTSGMAMEEPPTKTDELSSVEEHLFERGWQMGNSIAAEVQRTSTSDAEPGT